MSRKYDLPSNLKQKFKSSEHYNMELGELALISSIPEFKPREFPDSINLIWLRVVYMNVHSTVRKERKKKEKKLKGSPVYTC